MSGPGLQNGCLPCWSRLEDRIGSPSRGTLCALDRKAGCGVSPLFFWTVCRQELFMGMTGTLSIGMLAL